LKNVGVKPVFRVRVIAITIFALLFAQWNVAAYACPSPTAREAADAIAHVGCEGMASQLDSASPNLCAEHCQYGEQSDQLRVPSVPAMPVVGLYCVPLLLKFAPSGRLDTVSSSLLAARPPPHTLLHCRLQI
jgi:hypothetical protein